MHYALMLSADMPMTNVIVINSVFMVTVHVQINLIYFNWAFFQCLFNKIYEFGKNRHLFIQYHFVCAIVICLCLSNTQIINNK